MEHENKRTRVTTWEKTCRDLEADAVKGLRDDDHDLVRPPRSLRSLPLISVLSPTAPRCRRLACPHRPRHHESKAHRCYLWSVSYSHHDLCASLFFEKAQAYLSRRAYLIFALPRVFFRVSSAIILKRPCPLEKNSSTSLCLT